MKIILFCNSVNYSYIVQYSVHRWRGPLQMSERTVCEPSKEHKEAIESYTNIFRSKPYKRCKRIKPPLFHLNSPERYKFNT